MTHIRMSTLAVAVLVCCLYRGSMSGQNPSSSEVAKQDQSEAQTQGHYPTERVYRVGYGVTSPRVIHRVDPVVERARRAEEQGIVRLWLIVTKEGEPKDIKVAKSLSRELDQKAIDAVSQWKFSPATKDGKPVAVAINVEVTLKLF